MSSDVSVGLDRGWDCGPDSSAPFHIVEVAEGHGESLVALIAELAHAHGVAATVYLVGPRSAALAAASFGCTVIGHCCPPLRSPALAARTIRSGVDAVSAGSSRRCVVWGSAELAAILAGGGRAIHWVPIGAIARLRPWWARRLRGVHATVLMNELIPVLGQMFDGLTIDVAEPWIGECADDARGMIPIQPDPSGRMVIREAWGADDDTLVVGVVGPEPTWTDYRRAADVVGIAAVRGANVLLVGHPSCARADRSRRWMTEVGLRHNPLLVDERMARPWEIAHALDVGLVLGDGVRTAGGEAGGRRWSGRGLTIAPARFLAECTGPSVVLATPALPALWLARAGVPLLIESGAIEPELVGGSGDATFDVGDPLRATRAVLEWAREPAIRATVGQRGIDAIRGASQPSGWGRVFRNLDVTTNRP
jgi:hypothetical protein